MFRRALALFYQRRTGRRAGGQYAAPGFGNADPQGHRTRRRSGRQLHAGDRETGGAAKGSEKLYGAKDAAPGVTKPASAPILTLGADRKRSRHYPLSLHARRRARSAAGAAPLVLPV